ncbi:MAG: 3D domain-containing protein [Eubacterium sp.]
MNKYKFIPVFASMSLSLVMIAASANFHTVTYADVSTEDEVVEKEALEKSVLRENVFDFNDIESILDETESTSQEETTEETTKEETTKNSKKTKKKDTSTETSTEETTIEVETETTTVVIKETEATTETTTETEKTTKKKTKKNKTEKTTEESDSDDGYLGTFKITAYCGCSSCCGNSNGITASGTKATPGRTIAADTSVLPFGTRVSINGNTYVVEDRGGAISGNRIDIYFASHQEALNWGVRYCDVYIVD